MDVIIHSMLGFVVLLVLELLKEGVNPNATNADGMTALHEVS